MINTIGALRIRLGIDDRGADQALSRNQARLKAFSRNVATAAVAAVAVGGVAAARVISDFGESMSKLEAVTRPTNNELNALRITAQELGATTRFSAGEVADAMTFLGMAGFNAAETMDAIPGVLDLAAASGMELAQTADVLSNILSGFGMSAARAGEVSDILAAAASRANTDVGQLGDAMKYAAPVARALGIDVETTAAAVGVLSDAGIQGQMAGTQLRAIMLSLSAPTSQARAALDRLGLTLDDVNPSANDLTEILGKLEAAGMEAADAATIFGREASAGILALTASNDRVASLTAELEAANGAAGDMAATMSDNLAGDTRAALSALQGLAIELGDAGLTAILRGLLKVVRGVVGVLADFVRAVGVTARALHSMTAGVLGFGLTSHETQKAVDNLSLSLGDEVAAINAVSQSLPAGITLSEEAARGKLNEARAIYAKIAAAREEARATVMLSEEYRRLQRSHETLSTMLPEFAVNSERDGGEFAPMAAREGYERQLELINGLRSAMSQMLAGADIETDGFERAQAEIARLEAALASASDGVVTMGDAYVALGDRAVVEFDGIVDQVNATGDALDSEVTPAIERAGDAADALGDTFAGKLVPAVDGIADAIGDFAASGLSDWQGLHNDLLSVALKTIKQIVSAYAGAQIKMRLGLETVTTGADGGVLSFAGQGGGFWGSVGTGSIANGFVGGSGLIGGAASTLSATLGTGGGVGGLFSVGANAAAAGGGFAATLGAALPVVGIGLALLSLFKKKPIISAKDFAAINAGIELSGLALLETDDASKKAAKHLKKLAGGISEFSDLTAGYYDTFFTEAEKREKVMDVLAETFEALEMAMPTTASGFRDLVEGLDLSTAAGREAYVQLLQVSDAFASVYGGANDALAAMVGDLGNVFASKTEELLTAAAVARGESVAFVQSASGIIDPRRQFVLGVSDEQAAAAVSTARSLSEISSALRRWQVDGVPIGESMGV